MILTKEELVASITDYVGNDTSEKTLKFVTDAFDTIAQLDTDKSDEITRLQKQLDETNDAWRRKYMERFYSGIAGQPEGKTENVSVMEQAENISVNDLFE